MTMQTTLRQFRKERGLSLEALAANIGITRGHLYRIEREGTGSLTTATRLAQETGLPLEAFAPVPKVQVEAA